jgi:pimeloyl-ACP methyl ester carboxylesterase
MRKLRTTLWSVAFVGLLSLPAGTIKAQSNATSNPQPLGKMVDVGGHHLHLYCVGSGSPTVVILGAGFSFDWGLVQPDVAKFTQVCTYDPAGTAWSEPNSNVSCSQRVTELHTLLQNASLKGPYILVGQSIGAVVGRLYAATYPDELAGMVILDHAIIQIHHDTIVALNGPSGSPNALVPMPAPGGLSPGPQVVTMHSGPDASEKLPPEDQALHKWATSLPSFPNISGEYMGANEACMDELDSSAKDHPALLGTKPLVVVQAGIFPPPLADKRAKLQTDLLALSENSKAETAQNSHHDIEMEQPQIVVSAIQQVVTASQNHTALPKSD